MNVAQLKQISKSEAAKNKQKRGKIALILRIEKTKIEYAARHEFRIASIVMLHTLTTFQH